MSGVLTFVWSPVRFFEHRLQLSPNWTLALSAPILCGLLDMSAVFTLAAKNQAALEAILSPAGLTVGALQAAKVSTVMTAIGYPIYFALAAVILACLDVLTRDSGRQLRLIEFAGLAFFACIPSCVFMLAVAVCWSPPSVAAVAGASFLDVQGITARYVDAIRDGPWLSTAEVIYYCCLAWCVALQGVILKVISGFPATAAAAAAAAIFLGLSGFWR